VRTPTACSAGHAPFVWGTSVQSAVDNAVAPEKSAEMAILTGLVAGGVVPVLEEHMLEIHTERKHGANANYG
jgi:L-ribulose-5-phosphate 4-epimerase